MLTPLKFMLFLQDQPVMGLLHTLSKKMFHTVEVGHSSVVERTGIVLGVGDFIVVNSANGTSSFNVCSA